jgi:uncharacterized protein
MNKPQKTLPQHDDCENLCYQSTLMNIFINSHNQQLRSGWQVSVFMLLTIAISSALFEFSNQLLPQPSNDPQSNITIGLTGIINRVLPLLSGLAASAICSRYLRQTTWQIPGYSLHPRWLQHFLWGLPLAFVMVTVIVLLELVTGTVSFTGNANAEFSGKVLLLLIAAAAFEEVMFRGYPLQVLAANLSPLAAALILSVPFGLIHLGNPDATFFSTLNTILAGLWLTAAYFRTQSLWLATALHWCWNLSLGVIYGLPVSGITIFSATALFQTKPQSSPWFTGADYGPEGGLVGTLIMSAATALLYWQKLPSVQHLSPASLPPSPSVSPLSPPTEK